MQNNNKENYLEIDTLPSYHWCYRPKTETISVRLDFLKCVLIFIFFKTQVCKESVSLFSHKKRQICCVHTFCTDL